VIITSDNGPEVPTVLDMRAQYGHNGASPWRGVKRDNWEGGHRVPLVVRWPGRIPAGSETDQTICLTDLMATFAAIVGAELPRDAAEDSFNQLPTWLQRTTDPIREFTLHQTISLDLAIRHGRWKYLDHRGSGGSNYSRPGPWGMQIYALPDTSGGAPGQLYDLATDPGETRNLYRAEPAVVAKLKQQLDAFISSGRSAP